MLKVGLLGAGRIGQVHAAAIAGHGQSDLVAVSDVHEAAALHLAVKFNARVRPIADILADPEIDAVLIATSTDTHSDLIERATAAGKAVLCEKPVDLDLARARACAKALGGRPVMMGFNRRFDPNFSALKRALDAGEIGKIELLSITSFDPAPPAIPYVKVSGGLFRDMMIHDFDMANYLMGDLPKGIMAHASVLVDPEIGQAGDVDTAIVTLSYADGRLAVIKNSRRAVYGYDQRVEVLGAHGALCVQNQIENTLIKSNATGVLQAKPVLFFLERYGRAYAAEWDAFVKAVSSDDAYPVDLHDGIAALAMAEAAEASLKTAMPVDLTSV